MAQAVMPLARAPANACLRGGFIQRFDLVAIDADTAGDFHHLFIQHRRQGDGEIEQPRPRLVADPQRIGKAAVHHQQRAFALALQQRVGGDGGAHLHRLHHAGWDRCIERNAEYGLDAGDGGVAVATGVLAQQLVGGQMSVRMARDDVGERAAAVDPELPLAEHQAPRHARRLLCLPRQLPSDPGCTACPPALWRSPRTAAHPSLLLRFPDCRSRRTRTARRWCASDRPRRPRHRRRPVCCSPLPSRRGPSRPVPAAPPASSRSPPRTRASVHPASPGSWRSPLPPRTNR